MNGIYYRLRDLQGTVKPLECPSSTKFDGVPHLLKISYSVYLWLTRVGREKKKGL